jgi:hypothetical protein
MPAHHDTVDLTSLPPTPWDQVGFNTQTVFEAKEITNSNLNDPKAPGTKVTMYKRKTVVLIDSDSEEEEERFETTTSEVAPPPTSTKRKPNAEVEDSSSDSESDWDSEECPCKGCVPFQPASPSQELKGFEDLLNAYTEEVLAAPPALEDHSPQDSPIFTLPTHDAHGDLIERSPPRESDSPSATPPRHTVIANQQGFFYRSRYPSRPEPSDDLGTGGWCYSDDDD